VKEQEAKNDRIRMDKIEKTFLKNDDKLLKRREDADKALKVQ
jgi:hypothetical protein